MTMLATDEPAKDRSATVAMRILIDIVLDRLLRPPD
jgi:hypothetical protein